MRQIFFGGLILVSCLSCKGPYEKPEGVEANRDGDAVPIRLHNRTKVDLVILSFVRKGLVAYPTTSTIRLTSPVQSGPIAVMPDLQKAIFAGLPIVPDQIGGYSLEVCTDKTEVRYAVIDVTKPEMAEAKAAGKFIIVFREREISILVGKKHWIQPWMRDLPKSRPKSSNYAPAGT